MSPALSTFIFELLNFVTLAGVLGWLFFSPVRRAMEGRRRSLAEQAESAAARLAEAEAMRADMALRRETLDLELDALRRAARERAHEAAEAILDDAREEAARQRRVQLEEAVSLQQAETARLAVAVTRATQQVLRRLLERIGGPDLDDALLKSACRELGAYGDDLGPVTVESARPLTPDARVTVEQSLGAAAPQARYRVVGDLAAGVRIMSGRGLIDASVSGLTAYAEKVLSYQIQATLRENGHND